MELLNFENVNENPNCVKSGERPWTGLKLQQEMVILLSVSQLPDINVISVVGIILVNYTVLSNTISTHTSVLYY